MCILIRAGFPSDHPQLSNPWEETHCENTGAKSYTIQTVLGRGTCGNRSWHGYKNHHNTCNVYRIKSRALLSLRQKPKSLTDPKMQVSDTGSMLTSNSLQGPITPSLLRWAQRSNQYHLCRLQSSVASWQTPGHSRTTSTNPLSHASKLIAAAIAFLLKTMPTVTRHGEYHHLGVEL